MISLIAGMLQGSRIISDLSGTKLPWPHNRVDMAWFKNETIGRMVVMGRKTWDSLPEKSKPLVKRVNVILTNDKNFYCPGVFALHSVDEVLALQAHTPNIMVIGGASIYEQFLPFTTRLYLTEYEPTVVPRVEPVGLKFPEFDIKQWNTLFKSNHKASGIGNDMYNLTFRILQKDPNHAKP